MEGKARKLKKGLKLSEVKEVSKAVDSSNRESIDKVCKKYKISYDQAFEIHEQYMIES